MKYTSQNADNLPRYVDPGDYLLTVIEATETISKESGAEMIKLKLEVEGHGVHLFDYLVCTESSIWKIDTFRKAIGETVVENEEVELIAEELEGRQGRAQLRVEEYQGKKSNKVELWLTGNEALHPSKGFSSRSAPAPAARIRPQPEVDDDVPF